MSELQRVEQIVAAAARRRRWQRTWQGLWQGGLLGSGLWLLGLGLYKVLPLPEMTLAWAGLAGVLCVIGGAAAGFWRREGLLATAQWLDERQHLKERLSTALELGRDQKSGAWGELVARDAAALAGRVNVRDLLPWQLPRTSRWVLLVLALTAGLGFLPEYRSQAHLQRQREKEAVRDAGRNLAELSRRTLEKRTNALEATRQTLQAVAELGQRLEHRPATRDEALQEVVKLTEKVQQEARELAQNPALRSLERAARTGSQNSPAETEQLRRQTEALREALGDKEPAPEALEALERELQKARQAAANLRQAESAAAAHAAREQLARSLAQMTRQAADLGAALPDLEEALAALEAGQIDQVLKNLQVAAKDLEQLRDLARALQRAQQQQLAELATGRDLAEQLEKGQADAAIQTLRNMIQQLRAGSLSPEQLEKLREEVARAVRPGEKYGRAGESLQWAARQMQQSDQAGAAESLAAAARELEDLLQQLADAQALQAALDALKRAQMCIGNGLAWRQCQMPGGSNLNPQRGREAGWAVDENVLGDPERDPDPTDALNSTRVQGRFNPGAPMPSITLRGVSIKGQSTVELREAIIAAQSEAQAAVGREQIPRAYQGTVKDYFDDLK